jgi:hypothetical protein
MSEEYYQIVGKRIALLHRNGNPEGSFLTGHRIGWLETALGGTYAALIKKRANGKSTR